MTSPFRCEDCNGPITGTVAENAALDAGVRLCIGCIESMEQDRDAYDAEMVGECQFMTRVRQALAPAEARPGAGAASEGA